MHTLEYLFGLEFHGHKLGLDHILALTDALDRPHTAYPVLHVAGTNGKGSVCAMVAAALHHQGYRTACYTSPHLIDLGERFQVDGIPLPDHEIEAAIDDVRRVIDRLRDTGRLSLVPTFFEVATATAFELFRRSRVDVAVLEVGLGGRLDATNIVTPRAAAITNIALEHQQYLGDTLADIAAEKAGIIKPGITIATAVREPEALAVLQTAARDRGAVLREMTRDMAEVLGHEDGRVALRVTTPVRTYDAVSLGLRGTHQIDNALVAIGLLEAASTAGLPVSERATVDGLQDVRWPGRLDLRPWPGGGCVLLDAAHNPAGARTLASYLSLAYPHGLPVVIGAVRDKDHAAMLAEILPCASVMVATQPPTPRALPAEALAAVAAQVRNAAAYGRGTGPAILTESDPARAVSRALESADTVCVAGSIFLVGATLRACRAEARTW